MSSKSKQQQKQTKGLTKATPLPTKNNKPSACNLIALYKRQPAHEAQA
jgi:hypothetical protein